MVLPVTNVQQIFQYSMFHASILLGSFEKVFCVFDCPQVEFIGILCSECSPDCFTYDMFCRRGSVSSKKRISIEVSVGVKDTRIGH